MDNPSPRQSPIEAIVVKVGEHDSLPWEHLPESPNDSSIPNVWAYLILSLAVLIAVLLILGALYPATARKVSSAVVERGPAAASGCFQTREALAGWLAGIAIGILLWLHGEPSKRSMAVVAGIAAAHIVWLIAIHVTLGGTLFMLNACILLLASACFYQWLNVGTGIAITFVTVLLGVFYGNILANPPIPKPNTFALPVAHLFYAGLVWAFAMLPAILVAILTHDPSPPQPTNDNRPRNAPPPRPVDVGDRPSVWGM